MKLSEKEDIYEGLLIKESIKDENILDYLDINKVELWKTDNQPRYWTAITFTSNIIDLPERFSTVIIEPWYIDFKKNNIKYIVFSRLVLKYTIGNVEEKNRVMEQCRIQGIPDSQMDWSE